MSTAAQVAANQANAQHSTGPNTEAGKTASAQNNFRHGLSGAFVIQSWEKVEDYAQLRFGLLQEHQPNTPTESLLVERMAQHWWLGQRALRLQEFCFHEKGPMVNPDCEKELTLYLCYQTTHERAFSKCLNDLTKFRAEQRKAAERLERLALATRAEEAARQRQEAAETRKQEIHEAKVGALQAKTKLDEAKAAAKTTAAPKLTPADVFAADAAMEAELQAFLKAQAA